MPFDAPYRELSEYAENGLFSHRRGIKEYNIAKFRFLMVILVIVTSFFSSGSSKFGRGASLWGAPIVPLLTHPKIRSVTIATSTGGSKGAWIQGRIQWTAAARDWRSLQTSAVETFWAVIGCLLFTWLRCFIFQCIFIYFYQQYCALSTVCISV